jgi:ataxia telangiectasia mutated family protein
LGLEPLISDGDANGNEENWEAMVLPDKGTGIKKQVLQSLLSDMISTSSTAQTLRRGFQRIIWQNADVKFLFNHYFLFYY